MVIIFLALNCDFDNFVNYISILKIFLLITRVLLLSLIKAQNSNAEIEFKFTFGYHDFHNVDISDVWELSNLSYLLNIGVVFSMYICSNS